MNTEDIIKYSERNKTSTYNSVDRDEFVCLEINIMNESQWMKRVCSYAQKIVPNLNAGQANSSELRELSVVEIDNLFGLIAEYACEEILRWRYGKNLIVKPENNTSHNQIDLKLYNGKTIEVRSSCVRNGIDFAIFARDKKTKENSILML